MNKNKNTPILNDCGIDLDHPVLPVELASRRAERLAKEKKTVTTEQIAKQQLLKGECFVFFLGTFCPRRSGSDDINCYVLLKFTFVLD